MATSQVSSVGDLFFPASPFRRSRTDSAFSDADSMGSVSPTAQVESDLSGLNIRKDSAPATSSTLTFVPSPGSTCLSLYPRTKTFTYHSAPASPTEVFASTEEGLWKITASGELNAETARFTFERVLDEDVLASSPSSREVYKDCRVRLEGNESGSPVSGRRRSSVDKSWMRPMGARRSSVGIWL